MKKYLITWLTLMFLGYLSISFVLWKFNPYFWEIDVRGFYAFAYNTLSICFAGLYFNLSYQNK